MIVIFCVFALIVGFYQFYNFAYKAPRSEFAVQVSCEDKISVTGYFLRNEKVINSSGAKYYDIIVPSGGKVSKNGTIANVYSTDTAAKLQTEIRDLQIKIDEFDDIVSTASKFKDDISYSTEIQKNALDITRFSSNGKMNESFSSASEFVTSVIKNKIANGEITDYTDKLEALESQMETLKSKSSSAVKYISSPFSGYFSQKVDGAENALTLSMVDQIDSQKFENIQQICNDASLAQNSIGKVVEGSDWRVCFKANANKFENVKIGSSLYIRLPSVTEEKIKCTVVDLTKEGENAYIVLQSNMVTGDLISQRICDIDIIINSYSGIRIDKNAIRKIDGEDGVFVKSNGIIKYRKVDILYFANTYVVVKYEPAVSSRVQVFDEVIIRGSDLYDGKVVA